MIATNLKDFLKNPDAYSGTSFVNIHFDSEEIKDLTEALNVSAKIKGARELRKKWARESLAQSWVIV